MKTLLIISIFGALGLAICQPIYGPITDTNYKHDSAKATLKSITMALEMYNVQFDSYPPSDPTGTGGSEIIWRYLCCPQKVGKNEFPQMLPWSSERFIDAGNNNKKVVSPLGGDYGYIVLSDKYGAGRGYVLIDPGPDKKLGGRLDPDKGFIQEEDAVQDNITAVPIRPASR